MAELNQLVQIIIISNKSKRKWDTDTAGSKCMNNVKFL
jgi:hypothetical protein